LLETKQTGLAMNKKTHQGIPVINLADFHAYHSQYYWSLPEKYTTQLNYANQPHFSAFSRSEYRCKGQLAASRLDFYKVTFVTEGTGLFTYGSHQYEIKPNTLIFINPNEVKTWEATSEAQDGFYCLFNEQFLTQTASQLHEFNQYPYFGKSQPPVLFLTPAQVAIIQPLFLKLYQEFNELNSGRQEILRLTLQLLLAEARRFTSSAAEVTTPNNAAYHLTQRFLELLEKQFPIENKTDQLLTKAPAQFAEALAVHTNHLNACVKNITGKTVREHIQKRTVNEAIALLKYTDWRVSEIAFTLGFEEIASFTHFFKKETGYPPLIFRD
jgi:AraC family transcriptional activator of pobA